MTPNILVTVAIVGMLALVPLVLHWERQDGKHKRRGLAMNLAAYRLYKREEDEQ